jgi:hypothetical protein
MPKISEEMFDVRKLERFLNEGMLTPEQVEEHLASLEDCADNVETSTVHMVTHHTGRRIVSSDEDRHEEEEG